MDGMVSSWCIVYGYFGVRAQTKHRGSHDGAWKKERGSIGVLAVICERARIVDRTGTL